MRLLRNAWPFRRQTFKCITSDKRTCTRTYRDEFAPWGQNK
jgi:hypothetical protein